MASICIVLHDLRGGGAEKMMVRLANQLALDGEQVELVLIGSGGSNHKFVDQQRVQVTELNCARTLTAFMPLRRHLRRQNPDAILAVLTHINVLTALVCWSLGWQQRLCVSERNTFSLDKAVNASRVMQMTYWLAPFVYRWLPRPVVAVSRGVADDLAKAGRLEERHVCVAPNPVVNQETRLAAQQDACHPWLRNKQGPVVVAVGRLCEQKGFDWLLTAFAAMTVNNARLVVFGEGELRDALTIQAQNLNIAQRVDFAGYTDNPLAEIKHADLFVLSSRFEGSPNGLVEAMSVNTPVVAFDCPHGPKEILAGALASQLVPYGDVAALTQAMQQQLEGDSRLQLAPLLQDAIQKFTAPVAAAQYRRLLLQEDGA